MMRASLDPFDHANATADNQAPPPSVGSLHRNAAGELVVTSQDVEYEARGEALCLLSIVEYACVCRRTAKRKARSNGEPVEGDDGDMAAEAPTLGRTRNGVFQYDDVYALFDIFEQHLASLVTVPTFGGIASIPKWPPLSAEIRADELRPQQALFAEWVFAVLLPWPKSGHRYAFHGVSNDDEFDIVDDLHFVMRQLERGCFLLDDDGDFTGPPGYDEFCIPAILPSGEANEDHAAERFSQQCVARAIADFAKGLRRANVDDKKAQRIWRGRTAQLWESVDPEVCFPTFFSPSFPSISSPAPHSNLDIHASSPLPFSKRFFRSPTPTATSPLTTVSRFLRSNSRRSALH
jgi:hypothetical protein